MNQRPIAGLLVTQVIMHPKDCNRREFPHKLPAKFLNSTSVSRAEERAEEYSPAALLVNINAHADTHCVDRSALSAEGAHYRAQVAAVNALQQSAGENG